MILCCGEALIDMIPARLGDGREAFVPHAGGAVFNTAIALGRLGVPVEFLSGLSGDGFGDVLRGALAESRVGTRYAVASALHSTLAFVTLRDGQATYDFFDENSAGRMLSVADLPRIGDDVAAMHFGAISLIPEPCGTAYEALMAREHPRRVTMLDPNIRPGFIPDAAAHRARILRMAATADIVKLSDEDLAWFAPGEAPEEAARAWLALGPSLVVVTRGRHGAVAVSRAHRVEVPAARVAVVDTVGAGDTFNAGLLASLHEARLLTRSGVAALGTDAIEAALRFGVKVAGVTVSRAGANPPWRRELAGT
jgi:fructokinase